MLARPAHSVFATVGSLGDLYPLLAVGGELRRRGHQVTIATHEQHADTVAAAGLDFADASGLAIPDDAAAFFARAFHPWRGPRFVIRDLAAADVRASHHKLQRICADADVLVTSTLAFGAQIIGQTQPLCWLSAVLAPAGFVSATDPPAQAQADNPLQHFLDNGPAPLVFTLGSAAVHAGTTFLLHSLRVAALLQRRAIVLTGSAEVRAQLPNDLSDAVLALQYASHAALFPHACAIIHHGGVGTSQEALASGKPQLVVPHGFDQPDNAARLARLGVARVLPARRYEVERAAALLRRLLDDARVHACARECACALQREYGTRVAADRIEAVWRAHGTDRR